MGKNRDIILIKRIRKDLNMLLELKNLCSKRDTITEDDEKRFNRIKKDLAKEYGELNSKYHLFLGIQDFPGGKETRIDLPVQFLISSCRLIDILGMNGPENLRHIGINWEILLVMWLNSLGVSEGKAKKECDISESPPENKESNTDDKEMTTLAGILVAAYTLYIDKFLTVVSSFSNQFTYSIVRYGFTILATLWIISIVIKSFYLTSLDTKQKERIQKGLRLWYKIINFSTVFMFSTILSAYLTYFLLPYIGKYPQILTLILVLIIILLFKFICGIIMKRGKLNDKKST